jgi:uncharacterized protein (TIGR00297 family)
MLLLWIAALSGAIVVVFSSATLLHARLRVPHELSRKAVHVITGLSGAVLPLRVDRTILVCSCAALAVLLPLAERAGWLRGVVRPGRTLAGPLWFLGAYTALLMLVPDNRTLTAAVLIFALADTAAALAGQRWGRRRIAGGSRTWLGTSAFFLVALLVVIASEVLGGRSLLIVVPAAAGVALATAAAEAIAPSELDNFLIPVLAALGLHLSRDWTAVHAGIQLGALLFTLMVAWAATARTWLRVDGAMALAIVGWIVFSGQAYALVAILLLFFVSSSLLTRIGRDKLVQRDALSGRGAAQVVALGSVPAFAVVVHALEGSMIWLGAATAAVAAACADTWATEIGRHSQQRTFLITTLRPCERGTSGGVSALGLLGAFAGAACIGASGWVLGLVTIAGATMVAVAGFGASLIDSVLGATVQHRYYCARCGESSEEPAECHGRQKGRRSWSALSNEGVNLSMAFAAAALFWGWCFP